MFNTIKRIIIVGIGLALQILLVLFAYLYLGDKFLIVNIIYEFLGFLIVLWLMRNSKSYSYTLPWIVIILLFPIIGTLLYLIIGRNIKISKLYKNITANEKKMSKYLKQDKSIKEEIKNNTKLNYITNVAGFPASTNNDVEYYPLGEIAFEKFYFL